MASMPRRTSQRRRRPGLRAVAILVLAAGLGGCQPEDSRVRNGTDKEIDVVLETAVGDRRPAASDLRPGQGGVVGIGIGGGGCNTAQALVALGPDGTEIDRISGPFCEHFTWTVDGQPQRRP
jgi:hypothetical protein